jgi:hypothetical protein
VFLVEQNAYHALKLAHRGYVMVKGAITMSGGGRELLERPEVRAAYLEGGRQRERGNEQSGNEGQATHRGTRQCASGSTPR